MWLMALYMATSQLGKGTILACLADRLQFYIRPVDAGLAPAGQLLLLRVDRDHRLAGGQMLVRGLVDVLELRVAVRMRRAFLPFARRLQPVAQPAHSGRTHPPPLLGQRRRQLPATLARPAQRRGRVAARERVHQRFERGLDAGLFLLDAGAVRLQGVGCGPSGRLGYRPDSCGNTR